MVRDGAATSLLMVQFRSVRLQSNDVIRVNIMRPRLWLGISFLLSIKVLGILLGGLVLMIGFFFGLVLMCVSARLAGGWNSYLRMWWQRLTQS